MKLNPLVLALGLIPLVGCGGGSDSDSTSGYSVKAIDGYLRNAQVWLDLNGNYQLDDDEPNALSGEGGETTLDVTDIDNPEQYKVVVQAVPGQTIDEDTITDTNTDGTKVTTAYIMSAPPGEKVVTPFSTLVDIEMEENNVEADVAIRTVASELGIDEETLFDDYIAGDAGDTAAKASSIVELKILPKSTGDMIYLTDGDDSTGNIDDELTDTITDALSGLEQDELLVDDSGTLTIIEIVEEIDEVDETDDTYAEYLNTINADGYDKDGDGIINLLDAFPDDATEWSDFDNDGTGDNSDTDDDDDGALDNEDDFPYNASETNDTDGDLIGNNADTDDDGDGVADSSDDFPLDATETTDTDNDGTGDNADTDDDGDGVADSSDDFPLDATETTDTDNDGTGDNADTDDDGDGVADSSDDFPLDATETTDTDNDGTGDNADTDDDGDGIDDTDDNFPLSDTNTLVEEALKDQTIYLVTDSGWMESWAINEDITSIDWIGVDDSAGTISSSYSDLVLTQVNEEDDTHTFTFTDISSEYLTCYRTSTVYSSTDCRVFYDETDAYTYWESITDSDAGTETDVSSIIGTWSNAENSFTFDGTTYTHRNFNVEDGDGCLVGAETGEYTYDQITGEFTTTKLISNGDGECGLYLNDASDPDESPSITLSVAENSNYLTLEYEDGDESGSFDLYKAQGTTAAEYVAANPNFFFLDLELDNGGVELEYEDVLWNSSSYLISGTEYYFDFDSLTFIEEEDDDSDYILTSDGWSYSDDSDATLTPQEDGSMDYEGEDESFTITGEEWSLAGSNIYSFQDSIGIDKELLAYFDDDAVFSAEASLFVMNQESSTTTYNVWLETCDEDSEYTQIEVADTGFCNRTFTTSNGTAAESIGDLIASASFAEEPDQSWGNFNGIYWDQYVIRLVDNDSNSVDVYSMDWENNSMTLISDNVSWSAITLYNETLYTFSTEDEELSDINELFLTVIPDDEGTDYVRMGDMWGNDAEIMFNATAKQDILDAFNPISDDDGEDVFLITVDDEKAVLSIDVNDLDETAEYTHSLNVADAYLNDITQISAEVAIRNTQVPNDETLKTSVDLRYDNTQTDSDLYRMVARLRIDINEGSTVIKPYVYFCTDSNCDDEETFYPDEGDSDNTMVYRTEISTPVNAVKMAVEWDDDDNSFIFSYDDMTATISVDGYFTDEGLSVGHYAIERADIKTYVEASADDDFSITTYVDNVYVNGELYDNFATGTVDETLWDAYSGIDVDTRAQATGQSVAITDTDTSDSGELRINLDDALSAGKVSVNVKYAEGETQTAYLTLFGDSTSTSDAIADLKMDESNADTDGYVGIELRDADSSDDVAIAEYAAGVWVNISVEWDSDTGLITVAINNSEVGTYDMYNAYDVETISLKLANTNGISDYTFYVDDLTVYSDTTGETEVFSDDYEETTIGTDLGEGDDGNYSSSGFSAVVTDDDYVPEEATFFFSNEWLANRTLYNVWYGSGDNMETGEELDGDVAVVLKIDFDATGMATLTGLVNSYMPSDYFNYNVTDAGLLYFGSDSSNGNIIYGVTKDYLKTYYIEDGEVDNIDLYFFDKQTALDYADKLTDSIPE